MDSPRWWVAMKKGTRGWYFLILISMPLWWLIQMDGNLWRHHKISAGEERAEAWTSTETLTGSLPGREARGTPWMRNSGELTPFQVCCLKVLQDSVKFWRKFVFKALSLFSCSGCWLCLSEVCALSSLSSEVQYHKQLYSYNDISMDLSQSLGDGCSS